MAGLTLPDFEYDQTINVPLAAVDAEMAVYHQIMRDSGLMVSRVENIPNRLVVYVVTKFSLGQEYGDCGRLFIQFLDEKKTRLSFDVAAPDKFGAARFAVEGTLRLLGGLNPEKLKPDEFARGFSVLSHQCSASTRSDPSPSQHLPRVFLLGAPLIVQTVVLATSCQHRLMVPCNRPHNSSVVGKFVMSPSGPPG